MPSIYTIEGAAGSRRKRKRKGPLTPQQRRFKAAAKECKRQARKGGGSYQACMKRELKSRRR